MIKAESARILVVDDDESFLASMRRTFRGHFNLVTTTDPVLALKIFELQGPFAVVIADYQMPFMNGIQLFAKIFAMDSRVQRILMTGHAGLQMAIDAVNHGKITAFLTKPTPAVSIRSVVFAAIQTYNQNREIAAQELGAPAKINPLKTNPLSSELDVPLSVKELEVLALLAKGFSNDEIAAELNITVGTAKSHLHSLLGKMDVTSRAKIVAKAMELGLVNASTT
jgi:DNA-binding NarL/FixJ family response regulator